MCDLYLRAAADSVEWTVLAGVTFMGRFERHTGGWESPVMGCNVWGEPHLHILSNSWGGQWEGGKFQGFCSK